MSASFSSRSFFLVNLSRCWPAGRPIRPLGRSFIAENASASSNEGHARSERRREALVASAKDFSDFGGRPVALLEEHCDRVYLVPFFTRGRRGYFFG